MRVKKVNRDNCEGYLIFITSEEKEDTSIKNQIDYYKTISRNVAVFVSGNKNIEQQMKDMHIIGD